MPATGGVWGGVIPTPEETGFARAGGVRRLRWPLAVSKKITNPHRPSPLGFGNAAPSATAAALPHCWCRKRRWKGESRGPSRREREESESKKRDGGNPPEKSRLPQNLPLPRLSAARGNRTWLPGRACCIAAEPSAGELCPVQTGQTGLGGWPAARGGDRAGDSSGFGAAMVGEVRFPPPPPPPRHLRCRARPRPEELGPDRSEESGVPSSPESRLPLPSPGDGGASRAPFHPAWLPLASGQPGGTRLPMEMG